MMNFPFLRSTLTKEMIQLRTNQPDISRIKNLSLWESNLENVEVVGELEHLEILALSVNDIKTLSHFRNCNKLQQLFIRKNKIADLDELRHLRELPALRELWLEGNPCCEVMDDEKRLQILRILPQLERLEGTRVTPEERRKASNNVANVNESNSPSDKVLDESEATTSAGTSTAKKEDLTATYKDAIDSAATSTAKNKVSIISNATINRRKAAVTSTLNFIDTLDFDSLKKIDKIVRARMLKLKKAKAAAAAPAPEVKKVPDPQT